jgi:glycosyltransferase involved in cell wall biosynthesis
MGNSLALCMIVKNEQQFLPYCLGSIYKYCDEIIVIDTGSTDKTIEIAEAFGAYVVRAPWKDDFALVRNIAQSAAHSDWIIWLDGDEVVNDAGAKKIKNQLLNDSTSDFFLCPRVNFWHDLKHAIWYPDSQYKIYRNNIGLKWTGKLHEKIYDENNPHHRRRLKHCDVHTFHYAYVKSQEEVKKKMQLYIRIENPDMDPRQIEKCSVEHSFFYDKQPDGVQEYSGALPEIFNRLVVTQNEIRWTDGPSLVKFKNSISSANFNDDQVREIQKQTPQKKPESMLYEKHLKDFCSIVIATHNKLEYLSPLVRDIFNSVHMPFEVIVVDNGSTEGNILDFLIPMEKQHDNFKFVHLEKNGGFAKGYNEGVKVAKGEWIMCINNDTLPTDNFAEKLITHLKEDPEILMIGPVSNNIHGEHQMLAAPETYAFGDYLVLMNRLMKEQGKKRVYSSWITGCVVAFNRSLLDQLATVTEPPRNGILFCEDFFPGCAEDTDLVWTIQHKLQKKVGVARDTFFWHHGQKTLELLGNPQEIQHNAENVLRKRWPAMFAGK